MELCLHHSVQYTSRVGAAAESIFLLIFGLFSFFLILASRISSLQTQEWNEPDTENEKTAVPDVISGFNSTFSFCLFVPLQLHTDSILMLYNFSGQPSGEALVTFPSLDLAKKAVAEKNGQLLGGCCVELLLV